jgi:NDP-sugar pyrophosphorylase family protein
MAHAVSCAAPLVRDLGVADFVLASCDNIYPPGHVARLIARRRECGLDAALTLLWGSREAAAASAVAVLENGRVTEIIEKPEPAEIPTYAGRAEALTVPSLYALSSRVLDYVDRVTPSNRGEREFVDALALLIADGGEVGGTSVSGRKTLTRPDDLLILNRHFLHTKPESAVIAAEVGPDVSILPPVRIEPGATVAPGCRIGPDAYLEGGCRVGTNACVREAVVLRGARVRAGEIIERLVVSQGDAAA